MPELAWLSFLRGEWLLITRDSERELRKWSDADLALRDLEDEGWIIARPSPGKPKPMRGPRQKLLGYCLRRTVH